ncbi:ribosome small subunit-dependent GTPase A [Staphylococcus pettenkoferi]|uniref:ribosome small subunit-dependent GTPase A n=1 Tax=Staphylococcus pettenkoferi TaxID=170573 RepID=UPI0002431F82|nr:ribosome small subunit-dependent GTPase A [Staphylococcus pettenkoferi]ASE35891.1 ribosome small subunit-dependent GTPase A [Staphylococcus pettenkoferi]EHM70319.1 ribosome small subunit-dependent GTPase A [Staphylococcus pettenkoferi VCU012]MCY1580159.1 ribosome small subunit-dependent GTPase A [Staphylococcus pettenkoferi]MCY1620624.1 ribosome small subunit-dependent GTPase A [Staphylococcus pettenkoferi]
MKTGRIVKLISGVYQVDVDGALYNTKPRGLFRKKKFSPIVGDVVDFEVENESEGYIYHVHERTNQLKRPPVSNIDHLVIVMSAKAPDFSSQLLDRFLVIAHSYALAPSIVVTKKDLLSDDEAREVNERLEVYRDLGYSVEVVGRDDAVDQLFTNWSEGLVVLSGQSGVGKSTLLNKFHPELSLETQDISKALNRGRHTTRHIELFQFEKGYVADTPGFSALDFDHIDKSELKDYFVEIKDYGTACKFRDCMHMKEPKCHVKAQVETGAIRDFRYQHYVQLYEELANRKERY